MAGLYSAIRYSTKSLAVPIRRAREGGSPKQSFAVSPAVDSEIYKIIRPSENRRSVFLLQPEVQNKNTATAYPAVSARQPAPDGGIEIAGKLFQM